ncbi:MAG: glycosyltransferase family 1 protein [Rubricoccaceae bacterium]
MIVCDLTHAYHEASGGIRTYIDLKRRYILEQTDHHHVLVIPAAESGVERGERWTTYRIKAPYMPGAKPYRFFASSSALVSALEDARPDVTELNTFYVPFEQRAAFAYRDAHPDAIVGVHVHTDFADSYVRSYGQKVFGDRASRWLQGRATRYVHRLLQRADFATTLSSLHETRLREEGSTVELVPQFVDLEQYHPRHASMAFRERLGLAPDSLLLGYIGRMDTEKHIPMLLETVETLPESLHPHLVLAGEGPSREAVAAHAFTHDRVTLLPYISDKQEVAELLGSADIYVTAGPHEVAAFSVVEAQAAGLPVVGVASGGLINRIPTEDIGRLVPVDDAGAMAEAVAEIAADLETYSRAARHHAESNYSMERCFETTFEVYDRAMATV